jgi:hypothetical protein
VTEEFVDNADGEKAYATRKRKSPGDTENKHAPFHALKNLIYHISPYDFLYL